MAKIAHKTKLVTFPLFRVPPDEENTYITKISTFTQVRTEGAWSGEHGNFFLTRDQFLFCESSEW